MSQCDTASVLKKQSNHELKLPFLKETDVMTRILNYTGARLYYLTYHENFILEMGDDLFTSSEAQYTEISIFHVF